MGRADVENKVFLNRDGEVMKTRGCIPHPYIFASHDSLSCNSSTRYRMGYAASCFVTL